jgi:hypothetical protein
MKMLILMTVSFQQGFTFVTLKKVVDARRMSPFSAEKRDILRQGM